MKRALLVGAGLVAVLLAALAWSTWFVRGAEVSRAPSDGSTAPGDERSVPSSPGKRSLESAVQGHPPAPLESAEAGPDVGPESLPANDAALRHVKRSLGMPESRTRLSPTRGPRAPAEPASDK